MKGEQMHQLVSDGSLCEYYIPTCGSWYSSWRWWSIRPTTAPSCSAGFFVTLLDRQATSSSQLTLCPGHGNIHTTTQPVEKVSRKAHH